MDPLLDLDYIFKDLYPEGLVRPFFNNSANAFLALVVKDPEKSGEVWQLRTQTSAGGGASATFTKAQSNSKGPKGVRFLVDGTARDYSVEEIDGGQLLASRKDVGAMEDLATNAMSNAEEKLRKSMGYSAWGTGSGVLAKIVADLGGGQFSYDDVRASVFFDVGQVLESANAPTGGVLDAGTATITAIDRDAKVVTYTAAGGWAPVANHYVARDGDYDKKIRGIPAWIPFAAPTVGDNFFGVDRSVDTVKLAGIRADRSGDTSHREAMIKAGESFMRYGVMPSHVFCSPRDFVQFSAEYEGIAELQKIYVDVTTGRMTQALNSQGQGLMLGIEALKLPGGAMILQDQWAPEQYAYWLNLTTWYLGSVGKAPHFVGTETGEPKGVLRWRDSEDTAEVRARFLGQLVCEDPSKNGVVKLPAIA